MQPAEYIPYIAEIFLPITNNIIPNIRPGYFISNFGRVYSLLSNRLMKPTIGENGYHIVTVRKIDNTGIQIYIHRTELLVFNYIQGCKFLQVNHCDGNKLNNFLFNLEWVTIAENTRHASRMGLLLTGEDASWTKVTDEQVHQICSLYVDGYRMTDIVSITNCKMNRVFDILHGITRRNISSQYGIIPDPKYVSI